MVLKTKEVLYRKKETNTENFDAYVSRRDRSENSVFCSMFSDVGKTTEK